MQVNIQFNTDNSAFDDTPEIEVSRILRALAGRIRADGIPEELPIIDINGNRVGQFESH